MTAGPGKIEAASGTSQGAAVRGLWQRFGVSPVVLLLIGVLLLLIVPPLIFLIKTSFYTTTFTGGFDKFTTKFYIQLVRDPKFLTSLVNTAIYAIGSACVAIGLGVIQAWIVERTNTPLRKYVFLVSIVSLGIPSVLYTISFLLLLGRSGPVNEILDFFFATGRSGINVYSMWGMIIIEGIDFAPLAFLLLSSVFRSTDASFEEAAMMCGANVSRTFRRITMKLALPGVYALLILIFIRAFESFETPAFVGRPGGIYVLTTNIFENIQVDEPPNYGQAGAFAVALLVIVWGLLYWYNQLSRRAERYQTITGKGYRPRVMDLGRWKYLTSAVLVLLFMIIIGFPVGIVVYAAFQPFYEGVSLAGFSNMTLNNFVQVLKPGSFRDAITNTVILGVATASIVGPFTLLCSWLAVRRYRGAWLLDQLATMPLIFPSIVMGAAFLQVFLGSPIPLYGTLASIIIASSVRYLPYGMRYSYAGVLQVHKELEEAAALAGASRPKTFLRVVTPLVAPAVVTCWVFVFLVSTKAVSIPILLSGPDSQVVAVTMFDLWENGQTVELAAVGVTWAAFMTVLSGLFYVMARRYGLKFE
jgi:iron(III) transport system permease protein